MAKETVALHRKEVLQNLHAIQERLDGNTKLNQERHTNLKEDLTAIKSHLEKLNGRVGANERSISWMQGIGSVVAVIFTSSIAWLFNSK